ncbi:MAG: PQQ-binding-like beta-propeller repeat protein [Bryobacteraceae bacterium]
MKRYVVLAVWVAVAFGEPRSRPETGYREWEEYGGGAENIRYSRLDQINRANVHKLKVAWKYETGDSFRGSEMQCNPVIVDGVLYATSPKLRVIALDAATGKLRWSHDPSAGRGGKRRVRNRGVTYWRAGGDRRIFVTWEHELVALHAGTGKPVETFGHGGRVDLRQGLGRRPEDVSISVTTPGVIFGDLLIVGSSVGEDLPSAPGDIRAYDARTGAPRWTFHTIPHPGEYGAETWPAGAWMRTGGANAWAGLSLDRGRGIAYVPTGSAAFDFYGADRLGDNLFANSLIALNAKTGKRIWHFQTVKHDVWDRDLPAPPSLVTVARGGKLVDAVVQATKSGLLFVFERATGKPLYPIEYRRAPASHVDGEKLAAKQPFPVLPEPFTRQSFHAGNVTRRTPEAHRAVLEQLKHLETGGQFQPPSFAGGVIFPGLDGGAEWGGTAFDPESGLLYVNATERVQAIKLVERTLFHSLVDWVVADKPVGGEARATTTRDAYLSLCGGCHGSDFVGDNAPPLRDLGSRMKAADAEAIVRRGTGRMPRFPGISGREARGIVEYVMTGKSRPIELDSVEPPQLKYRRDGRGLIVDPEGYPGIEPPWGTLNAISMDTGKIAWKAPLGEFPELAAKGMKNTGSENYGGPAVTAGGLVFIGATNYDRKFRAFDKSTGKVLWETELPAAGNATPSVYEAAGKEYVVIGAGGGKDGQASGGSYVAFSLP